MTKDSSEYSTDMKEISMDQNSFILIKDFSSIRTQ